MQTRALALAGLPLIILIAAVAIVEYHRPQRGPDMLRIGRAVVHIELATTTAARSLGLGDRDSLASDSGMLFVFPDTGSHAFWMKDMRFSIDIVWLDDSARVIFIRRAVAPDTYPATFDAQSPSRYVVELPAGYARAHAIELGNEARFLNGTPLSSIPAQ